jgi:adenosylcobinamide-phosphate synthase
MIFSISSWYNLLGVQLLAPLLALALDLLLGDPPNRFHPTVAMGSFIFWIERQAPKEGRVRQFLFGAIMVSLGALLAALFALLVIWAISRLPFLVLLAVQVVLLKMTFSIRRMRRVACEIVSALRSGELDEARQLVSFHLVSRNTRQLETGHLASATIESLTESLTDSFVSPLFMYLLGGLPLAWAYRFVNTADSILGYRDERREYLGKFAARLDDVLNYIPARIAGLVVVLAASLANGSMRGAWRTMLHQHGRTASPASGWTMSAAAGALGVTLEKIDHYRLEGGDRQPAVVDILSARRLVSAAALLWALSCTLIIWALVEGGNVG